MGSEMKLWPILLALPLCICLLYLSPKAAQKQSPAAIGDFDSCAQSADCIFTVNYHSQRGDYSLAANERAFLSGRCQIISRDDASLVLRDVQVNYLLTISVNLQTARATVKLSDYARQINVTFVGDSAAACNCIGQ
jgi:hypothetical protein